MIYNVQYMRYIIPPKHCFWQPVHPDTQNQLFYKGILIRNCIAGTATSFLEMLDLGTIQNIAFGNLSTQTPKSTQTPRINSFIKEF